MSDNDTELDASKWKIGAYLLLAVVVALSWLGLGVVLDVDPTGFAVSEAAGTDAPDWDRPPETVAVDELRENLSRTNHGGESSVSMTAIWATETYFRASGLDAESYEVDHDDQHVFLVFLDTHTGTLPELDWQTEVRLRVDGATYRPVDGRTRAGGYHHAVAVVTFPRTVDGEPVLDDGTGAVTLEVAGLERNDPGVPDDRTRAVTWSYPPAYYGADPGAFQDSECGCDGTADDERIDAPARGGDR